MGAGDFGEFYVAPTALRGGCEPLSWACIGTAGKPADADSDPG